MQQLRAEQEQLQQHLDQLTTGQYELTTGGQLGVTSTDAGYQYRVHSSLSESSNGSLSSSTGYSSSEHGLYLSSTSTGWTKKTGPFLVDDNFAASNDRKACDMSKVCKFCLGKKCKTCMSVRLNILCYFA